MKRFFSWILRHLVWIWNPWPRKIKIVNPKTGGYVLDIRGRRKDRICGLINRKIKEEGGLKKCTRYKIGLGGSVDLSGSSG